LKADVNQLDAPVNNLTERVRNRNNQLKQTQDTFKAKEAQKLARQNQLQLIQDQQLENKQPITNIEW